MFYLGVFLPPLSFSKTPNQCNLSNQWGPSSSIFSFLFKYLYFIQRAGKSASFRLHKKVLGNARSLSVSIRWFCIIGKSLYMLPPGGPLGRGLMCSQRALNFQFQMIFIQRKTGCVRHMDKYKVHKTE